METNRNRGRGTPIQRQSRVSAQQSRPIQRPQPRPIQQERQAQYRRPPQNSNPQQRPRRVVSQRPLNQNPNTQKWYETEPMPYMTENLQTPKNTRVSQAYNEVKKVKEVVKPKKKIDYAMWIILLIISVALMYSVYSMNMLDMKYIFAIAGALILIVFLFLMGIVFRKKKSWRRFVARTAMGTLSIVMGFGSFTIYNGIRVLGNLTNSESVMRVSLATTQAESAPENIKDLSGKQVGYAVSSDKNAVCYAMSKLTDVKFVPYKDYVALYEALEKGEIATAIIPNAREETLKSQIKDFDNSVKYLTTYTSIRNPKDTQSTAKPVDISVEEPFVVYLAGLGEAGDASVDELTDVNILAFIDPAKREVTTVSIPRDCFVPNPALNMGSDKLTHLGMDGVYNSIKGLEETFGIEIDYYARVSFTSIIELVDALGGVTVDVEIPFTEQDENRSFAYNDLITLKAGKQNLNGKQALAYARHRKSYIDGTAGRERAQQKIIKAMVEKVCTAQGMANINNVLSVAEKYVSTDIPLPLIQGIVKKETADLQKWEVRSITLENIQNASLTTVSMPSLQLSCQLLSQNDLNIVHTLYETTFGEEKNGLTTDELLKKFNEHVKLNEKNNEQGLLADNSFYDDLTYPPANEYVITLEESSMINTNAPVYGIENIASEEEGDINTKLRLTIPKISSGYYGD